MPPESLTDRMAPNLTPAAAARDWASFRESSINCGITTERMASTLAWLGLNPTEYCRLRSGAGKGVRRLSRLLAVSMAEPAAMETEPDSSARTAPDESGPSPVATTVGLGSPALSRACFTCCGEESRAAATAMVNAASSATNVTVRLAGASMPSDVCAVATQESTANRRRERCFTRCLSLRHAERDTGVEGELRSRGATGGSERAPIGRRADPTDARVSAGVVRIAHTPDAAQLQAGGGGQRLGLLLRIGHK